MCGNDIQAKTEQDALTLFIKSRKPVTNKFKIKEVHGYKNDVFPTKR